LPYTLQLDVAYTMAARAAESIMESWS
jgi:hypothetical protein